jgi:hypothetical protein
MCIHISCWHNVVPLLLRPRMCTLIELVKADDGTSTERTMYQLYIVQFPWSEHIFLGFKTTWSWGAILRILKHFLRWLIYITQALIDTMTHSLAKKATEETAMCARLGWSLHGTRRCSHITFTCEGWYRYTGKEHDYDSDELPDLV